MDDESRAQPHAAASVVAVCGLAFEAAIAAGPGVITLCGLGAGSLETLLAQHGQACCGIISFGTAGGLAPDLQPGACVLAQRVVTPDRDFAVDADWLAALRACLPDAATGTLAGVEHPVADAASKARLRQSSGACAVDMESHRAALLAQRHGVPFAACRVIVDHADRHVPSAAIEGVNADGTIALSRLLRELALHPGQLAGCIVLAFDAAAARRQLRAVRLAMGAAFALPTHAAPVSSPVTEL
ncbi:MAG: squalene--hopene cyclase [Burkholderia sp.]|jgi:hopanoid-associated phosphorylase|nr:squalene--hopene cyclase [Burkholderia sp.]